MIICCVNFVFSKEIQAAICHLLCVSEIDGDGLEWEKNRNEGRIIRCDLQIEGDSIGGKKNS
jgi:hypothetical protein